MNATSIEPLPIGMEDFRLDGLEVATNLSDVLLEDLSDFTGSLDGDLGLSWLCALDESPEELPASPTSVGKSESPTSSGKRKRVETDSTTPKPKKQAASTNNKDKKDKKESSLTSRQEIRRHNNRLSAARSRRRQQEHLRQLEEKAAALQQRNDYLTAIVSQLVDTGNSAYNVAPPMMPADQVYCPCPSWTY